MNSTNKKMSINGIIVCVGWGKILEQTLKENTITFDNIYVVTKIGDTHTQKICNKYKNVHVLKYDFKIDKDVWASQHEKYMLNGSPKNQRDKWFKDKANKDIFEAKYQRINEICFNKGGAIKLAQQIVYEKHPESFHVLLDSDIILKDDILPYINNSNTQNVNIYDKVNHTSHLAPDLQVDVMYGATYRLNYSSLQDYRNKKAVQTDAGIAGHFMLYKSTKKHLMDEWTGGCGADVWFPFGLPPYRFTKHARLPITIHHLGAPLRSVGLGKFNFTL